MRWDAVRLQWSQLLQKVQLQSQGWVPTLPLSCRVHATVFHKGMRIDMAELSDVNCFLGNTNRQPNPGGAAPVLQDRGPEIATIVSCGGREAARDLLDVREY